MYEWRKLTAKQRQEVLARRKSLGYPLHSPPHVGIGEGLFHIGAACYEHRPVIGQTLARMIEFETVLLETANRLCRAIFAWCVLPNHYHLLLETESLGHLVEGIGKLHGRSSFRWNGEDDRRGRTVWRRCSDRAIRSEGHFWATMNYVHHNPVKHGYVEKWQDWPFSSAASFLENIGPERAAEIWREFPVLDYGRGWDWDDEQEREKRAPSKTS